MTNIKIGFLFLSLLLVTGCSTNSSLADLQENWIKGEASLGRITTIKRFAWLNYDNYWYKLSDAVGGNAIEIQLIGEHIVDSAHPDQIPSLAANICFRTKGTPLKMIITKPTRRLLAHVYPAIVTASCLSKEENAERLVEEQRAKDAVTKEYRYKQLMRIKDREERKEKEKKITEDKLKQKQSDCTSFGFTPSSNEHAECVMKLTIAQRQQQKDVEEAANLASLRRAQITQQDAANTKEAEDAKRQRDAALLMGIGGNISAGRSPLDFSTPKESTSAKDSTPLGYKNCRYRVAGGVVSVTISNAQVCSSTRQFDGNVGYLTQ